MTTCGTIGEATLSPSEALAKDIREMRGPILVIGAGGFVGANLFHLIRSIRDDVYAGINTLSNWRLSGVDSPHLVRINLHDTAMVEEVLQLTGARTIFYTAAYGAYSFQDKFRSIHEINYLALIDFLELAKEIEVEAIVHAGTSSEYGLNAAAPSEESPTKPNSHYAVSKLSAAAAISYYGTVVKVPIVNLRIYSAYGAFEDSSRLIPVLVREARSGGYPPLTNQKISRDFVYIVDVVHAFVRAALTMSEKTLGRSYNIGTGRRTTIDDLAGIAADVFEIPDKPEYGSYPQRAWDITDWYADPSAAEKNLGWRAETSLEEGLRLTANWQESLPDEAEYWASTKSTISEEKRRSIAAIVACYRDAQAIPIMYQRLRTVFEDLDVDYQIIFVNDCSPDNSEEVIRKISRDDPCVLGITHTRNFGSQMAFRSGMELAFTDACVLLDGDLQDPPELVREFYKKWVEGYDVVYGHRVHREMGRFLHFFYRLFYLIFHKVAEFNIPRDAGDFSLIDRKAVRVLLTAPERDLFLRGLRAYVGFRQTGVPYERPERMFGVSTNNWLKNIAWAKKAIFSYSNQPLHILTGAGIGLFCLSGLFLIYVVIAAMIDQTVLRGIPIIAVLILFFGGLHLMALSMLGEYIGKIIVEVKRRPPFVRHAFIHDGKVETDIPESGRVPRETGR